MQSSLYLPQQKQVFLWDQICTADQLETCHHWFRDTSHGGLIGQIILSKTHRESNPAFSAPFARLIMFSFVA
jgi:hypothetical protein